MSTDLRRPRIVPRIIVLLIVFLTLGILDPFGYKKKPTDKTGTTVVCTFLPVYVFALNVIGDTPGMNVELMVSADVGCPHHYSLRPADQMKLARADVVVANGLGMEPFLDEMMKSHPKVKMITISDDCEVIGARCSHDHAHEGDEHGAKGTEASSTGDEGVHEPTHGPNGHVWVSPKEAAKQVVTIGKKLGETYPQHRDRFEANARAYVAKLEALQAKMKEVGAGFMNRKIVTMHDSFDYLARDLGLEVVGLLQVEADQSPTAHEMAELVDAIKREKVACIFYEPSSPVRVAETVARDAGVPAYELNPLTSFAGTPTAGTYEDVMNKNLETLKKALGGGL